MSQSTPAPANAGTPSPLQVWLRAYRVELTLFVGAFLILAAFSSKRFWRQSEAPHFVYQSKAFLEGRSDIAFDVLPNFEDWACVREAGGVKGRFTRLPANQAPTNIPMITRPMTAAMTSTRIG